MVHPPAAAPPVVAQIPAAPDDEGMWLSPGYNRHKRCLAPLYSGSVYVSLGPMGVPAAALSMEMCIFYTCSLLDVGGRLFCH